MSNATLVPAVARATFRHLKANGTLYEIEAQVCDAHAAGLRAGSRVLSEVPLIVGGYCDFCAERPYRVVRPIGRVQ